MRHCQTVSGDQVVKILVNQACYAWEVLSVKYLFLCFDLICSSPSEQFIISQPEWIKNMVGAGLGFRD